MNQMTQKPLSHFSQQHPVLPQQIVVYGASFGADSTEMIRIPSVCGFNFIVKGIESKEATLQEWIFSTLGKIWPGDTHLIDIDEFLIDRFPVTNREFKAFVDGTGYQPVNDYNFLKDWVNGSFPASWENKPVTWVSLNDAKSFAAWREKRLPNEWEWQYAAQGLDGRLYPWGNEWNSDNVPTRNEGRTMRGPDEVGAHPQGASPFGVEDMMGNVWQRTNEWADKHTRAAALRGWSYYYPQGSMWYFPQAKSLFEHGKYLLMSDSYDRAGTVGFRSVSDVKK